MNKQTTNVGVLLELGRSPLYINAVKLAVKNWERIRKGNANTILFASYNDSIELNLPWIQGIKGHLKRNGLLSLFLNEYPDAGNFIHKKLFGVMMDQFHQSAFSSIGNSRSKLRTYALIKTEIGIEKYLIEMKNCELRIKGEVTWRRISTNDKSPVAYLMSVTQTLFCSKICFVNIPCNPSPEFVLV